MHRLARLLSVSAVLLCALCGVAFADGPVGADPQANFPVNRLPAACDQPTSAACLDASVGFLNQARAGLGQGPYQLPADFDALSPQIQQFVLTNLDRIQYGLAPITGITAGLSQDALGGVTRDTDPHPTDPNFNYWTANWAGGFENVVLAYEAWMYDDGPGSGNLDCTSRDASGCWGHRHDVLWSFDGSGPLAMGSAVATDPSGSPGYAMVLGEGDAGSYQPAYTYTWSQALNDGAGAGSSAPHSGAGHSGPGATSSTGAPAPAPAPAPKRATITVRPNPGHHRHHRRRRLPSAPASISRRHPRGRAARVHAAHAARAHAARAHAARGRITAAALALRTAP